MKYLGVRFLKKWVKERFGEMEDPLRYEKYRGDEWIKNEEIDVFCVQGKMIYVSLYAYDRRLEKPIELERRSYHLEENEWVIKYQRIRRI